MHLRLDLPQQGVVPPNLSVQLAAVRDKALGLHRPGGDALVDGGLFVDSLRGKAAVVNPGVDPFFFQNTVDSIRPRLPPGHKLLLAVPPFRDGVLPSVLCAFRILGRPYKPPGFGGGGCHIFFLFLPGFVRVLLFPALRLRRLELFGS